jgi:hypothetical protein
MSDSFKAIATVVLILLLGVNAWLIWNKMKQDKTIKEQKVELDDLSTAKLELEKGYYEALAELEEQRGENTNLNTMIDEQKEELTNQKRKIDQMIRENRDLKSVREELNNMKALASSYMAEIDKLKNENLQLTQTNVVLQKEVTREKAVSDSLGMQTEVLSVAKQELESVAQELESEKTFLEKKVTKASAILTNNISVQGYKVSEKGRESKTNRAAKINLLRSCFENKENQLVMSGDETFYLRIVSPMGETLAVEDQGSGVLVNEETDKRVRYTKAKTFPLDGSKMVNCIDWTISNPLGTGEYSLEIYNKGYLVGSSSFELK